MVFAMSLSCCHHDRHTANAYEFQDFREFIAALYNLCAQSKIGLIRFAFQLYDLGEVHCGVPFPRFVWGSKLHIFFLHPQTVADPLTTLR